MKRFSFSLNHKDSIALETLVALHESPQEIILTYGDLSEPKVFAKAMLERCQTLQAYYLWEESSTPTPKEYILLGLNDKARILCFVERGNDAWLNEHKLELLAPKSFHLSWDKLAGFKIKWV